MCRGAHAFLGKVVIGRDALHKITAQRGLCLTEVNGTVSCEWAFTWLGPSEDANQAHMASLVDLVFAEYVLAEGFDGVKWKVEATGKGRFAAAITQGGES